MPITWHDEDPALLREAIGYTAARTGFVPRLLEKDYFCSVALEYLSHGDSLLVFKGGTCLAKIHSGFYRLSEDLDFSIPTPQGANRTDRRRLSATFKRLIVELPNVLPVFEHLTPLQGANNSTQYVASFAYESLLDSHRESVRIEVGLREPLVVQPHVGRARTNLLNPLNGDDLVDPFPVRCHGYVEAMAEKLRAAMCRRDVAIRDFFDVDHAIRHSNLNIVDGTLLRVLRRKISVPGTSPVDMSPPRMRQLERQLEARLRPVLGGRDFEEFDLERAVETVAQIAKEIGQA